MIFVTESPGNNAKDLVRGLNVSSTSRSRVSLVGFIAGGSHGIYTHDDIRIVTLGSR